MLLACAPFDKNCFQNIRRSPVAADSSPSCKDTAKRTHARLFCQRPLLCGDAIFPKLALTTSRHRRSVPLTSCTEDKQSSINSNLSCIDTDRFPRKWKGYVTTPLYKYWLQGGVALLVLMLIDAAYSGDWSRIGAISKESELQLQEVATAVGAVNVFCFMTGAVVVTRRQEGSWLGVFKILLSGPLGLIGVCADVSDEQ